MVAKDILQKVKIQVYCPTEVADTVRLAIGAAGGGQIGKYQYCAFVSSGTGYFLPLEGAVPAIGRVGKISQVAEVKIEFLCSTEKVKPVIAAIKAVHPYEEIPIEVYSLVDID